MFFVSHPEPAAEGLEEEERDVDLVFLDDAHTTTSNNSETLGKCNAVVTPNASLYCESHAK